MTRRAIFALIGAIAFAFAGCEESQKAASEVAVAPASAPSKWTGVKNLSQEGEIYFAGQPTADQFAAASDQGIKIVVNLRSEAEMKALDFDEQELVRKLGMEYVFIPITPDTFGPTDADKLSEVLETKPGHVLIHCASSNRVGALWAMYLHRHRDVALDEAIDRGKKAGLRSDALVKTIRDSSE